MGNATATFVSQRRLAWTGAFALIAASITGPAALGQSDQSRLQELEEGLKKTNAEIAQIQERVARQSEQQAAIEKAIAHAESASALPGYNDGFILADAPDFSLKLNGLLQPRYVYTHADNDAADEDENGFVIRRAELYLSGKAFDPKLTFQFFGGFDRATGNFQVIFANVAYQVTDQWQIRGGVFKGPFTIEELTSPAKLQVMERSLINSLYTMGCTEGLQAQFNDGPFRVAVMVHDGSSSASSDFLSDTTDWGVAARAEYRFGSDWKWFGDVEGWTKCPRGARLGVAIDYEAAETGTATTGEDLTKYTVDLTLKEKNWSALLAAFGRHTRVADQDVNQYALLAQAGYFVVPDKVELYARYEFMALDGYFASTPTDEDAVHIATIGYNYFFRGHNAKFTTDIGYVFNGVPVGNSGVGLLASPDGPQVILRTGFTFSF